MGSQREIDFLQLQEKQLSALLSGKIPDIPLSELLYGEDGPDGEGGQDGEGGREAPPAGGEYGPGAGGDSESGAAGELIKSCAEKFEKLVSQIKEMRVFMQALCLGNLSAEVPGRRNYLSAPLKELHTQFSSLTWSMEQLAKGNIVSRLYYQGVLFESFNSLINKVAIVSNQLETARSKEQTWEWSVNSWRYHQILSALNNLRIMVLEVAQDGKIVYANRPATEYFGEIKYLKRAADDKQNSEGDEVITSGKGKVITVPGAVANAHPAVKNAMSLSGELEDYLARIGDEDADGHFPKFREIFDEPNNSWYKITSDIVHFSDSRTGYLHMIDNISEWKKNESTLKQTATTDPLTGVYNRGFGLQALEEALNESRNGTPSCAAFIDMDDLKKINDVYGHNSGDYAIRTIADALTSSVRDNNDVVCRFGGDEFIIIFKNCTEPVAQKAILRMRDKLREINKDKPSDFVLDFSHGIVQIDNTNDIELKTVIEEMDKTMYKNKSERKRAAMLAKEKAAALPEAKLQ